MVSPEARGAWKHPGLNFTAYVLVFETNPIIGRSSRTSLLSTSGNLARLMRVAVVAISVLLIGSLAFVNSPGAAVDPIKAERQDLLDYIAVSNDMHERWQALDAVCDPDAVFSLLYLITTAAVGDLVAANHFEDNPYLVEWDRDFADRYFAAYDAYHSGAWTPEPWRIAFEHADSGNSTVGEDLLLGMNAHVNYDLAFSAYAMQLPQMGQKDEYDRVNDAFWNVVVPSGNEFGARYDPGSARSSQELTEEDQATVELLISWREAAWVNAVALAAAPTDWARQAVANNIEATAGAIARGLAQNDNDTTVDRVAYCHNSGHPPLADDLGGAGYGLEWLEDHNTVTFWICHRPGTSAQETILSNDHSWTGHAHHGDTRGAC